MKTMKKLLVMVMVIAMIAAMALTANAAGDGEITITNTVSGVNYQVYKVFDLESYDLDNANFVFTPDSDWATFAAASDYVEVTDGVISMSTDWNVEAFAKSVAAAGIAADQSVTATSATLEITGLEHGYYVIASDRGANCIAVTVVSGGMVDASGNTIASINEKNDSLPSISKEADKETAFIGDTVTFTVTVAADDGALNYVIHDTMNGLDFAEIKSVTLNGAAYDKYTSTTSATDNCALEITFTDCASLKTNDKLVVTYTAKLSNDAVIAGEGNVNTAMLTYDAYTVANTEKKASVTVKTYQLDVKKVDENGQALKDASFKLYYTDDSSNKHYAQVADGKFVAWGTEAEANVLGGTGISEFSVAGLANGTYYLEEIDAPAGYVKLTQPKSVTISNANVEIEIENAPGIGLPETGGVGTTIFYVMGGILVVGALALLLTKKRVGRA